MGQQVNWRIKSRQGAQHGDEFAVTTREWHGKRCKACARFHGHEQPRHGVASGHDPGRGGNRSKPFRRMVISDVAMPEMHGFELTRRLLAMDAGTKMLFMSSMIPDQHGAGEDLLQRFGLLRKPFDMQTLLQTVQAALARNPGAAQK